jgi:adenylate cyclase
VDEVVGDGAAVLFAMLEVAPAAAARAVDCARVCVGELALVHWRKLRLVVGAHGGEVVAGAIGDDARLEFSVVGDAVNVVAWLEDRAELLERSIVASCALLEAAVEVLGWEPLPRARLRGRAREHALYATPRSTSAGAWARRIIPR